MNTDTLDHQLAAMGTEDVPEPRPEFALALEERLAAGDVPGLVPAPVRRERRSWLAFPAPAVAALAATALVVGLVAVRGGDGERALRVATAVDALVVLPDGTVDAAVPGQIVPDGTRIVTGDEGHVTAGEVELGPNREGVVSGGVLDPNPAPTFAAPPTKPPATSPTAPATQPPTTKPAPSGEDPGTPPGPGTTPPESTTPTTASTGPAVAVVEPVGTDPKPTTQTTTTKPASTTPATLKIEAKWRGEKVFVRWSAYSSKDFAAWLVLRADAPNEPGYPVDERTTVVARIEDPSVLSHFDYVANPAGRSYRVVAVDHERRVLAASPAIRPVADEQNVTAYSTSNTASSATRP